MKFGGARAEWRDGWETLAGLAIAAAGFSGPFVLPDRSGWIVAGVMLWAGATLVARARGWTFRKPTSATHEPVRPRVRPLKPGESYEDAVKLAFVPNVPLAEVWCQRLRENGIEAFYKGSSPFGADSVGIAPLNPALPAELWVGRHDLPRARKLFPELR